MNEEEEMPIWMLYPTFVIVEERGIIPSVNLPQNYKNLVKRFNEQERRIEIEEYVKSLEDMLAKSNITQTSPQIFLKWDNDLGLTNISIGIHGGFDLNDDEVPHFQEHNLGGENGLVAACIATKYVSELLQSG